MRTVVVGMSGGVDSSVSALLLKSQGYKVIGLFMKNWEEPSGDCNATADYEDVLRVCAQLEIPCYPVNFVKEYWDLVFSQFLKELELGYTPNPDILCNREIKFNLFLEKALELGADFLATGHYCQIGPDFTLLKGIDPEKDQSYFLYTLSQNVLKKVLFPVGGLLKSEVRRLAHEHSLSTAAKKDSTGICFIGKRDMKTFLKPYLGYQPGSFETPDGTVVGEHVGMAYYTLGQRKGLGIGGPGEAWFVIGKDLKRDVVRLAQGADHPSLYVSSLIATDLTWISHPVECTCTAKVRYRQEDQPCSVEFLTPTTARVTFDTPQRAPAARQSIVFYQGSTCLGGGLISPDTLPFYE